MFTEEILPALCPSLSGSQQTALLCPQCPLCTPHIHSLLSHHPGPSLGMHCSWSESLCVWDLGLTSREKHRSFSRGLPLGFVPTEPVNAAIPAATAFSIFLLIDYLVCEIWGLKVFAGDLCIFTAIYLTAETYPSSKDSFQQIFFWCNVLWDPGNQLKLIFILFIYLFYFNLKIVALQDFGGFCHTSTWVSHRCTCAILSWTPLPPPSPPHISGLSQGTCFLCPASCDKLALGICFVFSNVHVSVLFSQIIPPLPFPTESKKLFFTSVSLLLPCI